MKIDKNRAWKIFNGVTIVVALVVIVSVVLTQGIDTIVARLTTLDAGWLLAAVGFMALFWAFESLLLHTISASVYKDVKFSSSLHAVMIGQLYSALTPFSSGGQPVQLMAMERDGMDAGGAGSALTLKSLTWQIGLTLYAVVGAIYGWGFFSTRVAGFKVVFGVGLAINLVVILAIFAFAASRRVTDMLMNGIIDVLAKLRLSRKPDKLKERARRQFAIFHKSMGAFTGRPLVWVASAVLTALQFFCYYMVAYAVYRSFGLSTYGAPILISAVSLVTLIAAFIPLPGGSGGAEGAFYIFFGLFFGQKDVVFALLLWRLITYYSAIVIGAIALFFEKHDRPKATRLTRM